MKIPFLGPVVPPHVFCLLDEGVTYARVRAEAPAGFAEARHFRYPAGSLAGPAAGAPLVTREAIAEAVKAARALSDGRLTRASVVFPDSWSRILPVELETLPSDRAAGAEMVSWKLKKLLPASAGDLAIVYEPMPVLSEEKRVLATATPRAALEAIERAFDELGVRVGYLAPSSLALFEGLASTLADAAGGDYALLQRSADGALSFFIARGQDPIFFRQRPPGDEEDQEREARLSLSYYAERLMGPGLKAVFVHGEEPGGEAGGSAFPVAPAAIGGSLFDADAGFDERIASRPELLAGFAAVYGKS